MMVTLRRPAVSAPGSSKTPHVTAAAAVGCAGSLQDDYRRRGRSVGLCQGAKGDEEAEEASEEGCRGLG